MCGRYSLTATPAEIEACFGLEEPATLAPRYNIAPTQLVPIVRLSSQGSRELVLLRWGLIPASARDASIGQKLINARAETVAEKPSFRDAFASRRCLVVADGFYEWRHAQGRKVPYLVRLRSRSPFAFAGLWEQWRRDATSSLVETCAIITTDANELVSTLHDRMPVLLDAHAFSTWLSPDTPPALLHELLRPTPAGLCEAQAVSSIVNDPKNDVPECVLPAVIPTNRELFE